MNFSRFNLICVLAFASGVASASADTVQEINAAFGRDVLRSDASILIIGDSTNDPRGAGSYVTYYEGLVLRMPYDIELCGFRFSGSTGNVGVNSYVRFTYGSTNQMVGGRVYARDGLVPVATSDHRPPGYRNEFQLNPDGGLSAENPFGRIGFSNLSGVLPRAESWIVGQDLVIRTPVFVDPEAEILPSFSIATLEDHDGSAGTQIGQFETGQKVDVHLHGVSAGLQCIDVEFAQPASSRIGVGFFGDLDEDDADEGGKVFSWADHVLFSQTRADADRGIYLDSFSVGGYTALDHVNATEPEMLQAYVACAPRPISYVLIWLGQNAELDEFNGSVQQAYSDRIELLGDRAIAAVTGAGGAEPTIVLCTPPDARAIYPSNRFSEMSVALQALAVKRGWGHINIHAMLGNSLIQMNPDFVGPGPHPTGLGASFLADFLYDYLRCVAIDYDADAQITFLDVSRFIQYFTEQDELADLNGDGEINFFDISLFLSAYSNDCSLQ
ncbi:MAG: GC-type dockerin domain-anchored protein [Phycisphaerales bacterium JB052]